jgi:hypothetical protein
MDEQRGPDELAAACRSMAKDLRENSHECQHMMSRAVYREGRAQLMEEIAAVLESPGVVAHLKALKIILRGISE